MNTWTFWSSCILCTFCSSFYYRYLITLVIRTGTFCTVRIFIYLTYLLLPVSNLPSNEYMYNCTLCSFVPCVPYVPSGTDIWSYFKWEHVTYVPRVPFVPNSSCVPGVPHVTCATSIWSSFKCVHVSYVHVLYLCTFCIFCTLVTSCAVSDHPSHEYMYLEYLMFLMYHVYLMYPLHLVYLLYLKYHLYLLLLMFPLYSLCYQYLIIL